MEKRSSCWRQSVWTRQKTVVLENNLVAVEFDTSTGVLCSIVQKELGQEFLRYKGSPQLFRLVYALKDFRGHHLDACRQKVSRIDLVENGGEKTLTIEYGQMCSREGMFAVTVSIRATLVEGSDELVMGLHVSNDDRGELTQVWFPWVRGLVTVSEDGKDDVLCYPAGAGSLIPRPIEFFPRRGEPLGYHEHTRALAKTVLAKSYPGHSSMQWMDFGSSACGLYLCSHDRDGMFMVPRVQKHLWDDTEHLSMAMVRYPYARGGQSWTSPEFVLSPHRGDWHRSADKYRIWLEGWQAKREKAAWAGNTNGFCHLILRHQDGSTVNEIAELDEILAEAKAHGIDLLFVCGWYVGGHDGAYYPEYNPIDPVALPEAFERVHKSGGRLLLYLNMRASNMGRPDFTARFLPWAIKSHDGLVNVTEWGWAVGNYPSFEAVRFGNLCPHAAGWQDMFVGEMKKAVALGADCGLMDQLLVADMCHDTRHGHSSPEASYGPGALRMARQTLAAGKQANPEFEIAMEGVCDLYAPEVAVYHSRCDFPAHAAPEVFRYTLPWVTGISGGCVDMGDLEKARETFLLGLVFDLEIHTHNRGRLSFDPRISVEVKKINDLRRAHRDLFVDGQFRDRVGLAVSSRSVDGRLFVAEKARMITLWNKGQRTATPTVRLTDPTGFPKGIRASLDRTGRPEDREELRCRLGGEGLAVACPSFDPGGIAVLRLEWS